MSITKEQAEKLRKLHVNHVTTANDLAVYEDRVMDRPEQGRNLPEWKQKRSDWRKAHTAFYAYVDELETE